MTIFLLLGLLLTVDAAAQRRIFGTVTDGYREPLPGATIMVKKRPTLGAVTDAEGRYELRLPDNGSYTLTASYIGYFDAAQTVGGTRNDTVARMSCPSTVSNVAGK